MSRASINDTKHLKASTLHSFTDAVFTDAVFTDAVSSAHPTTAASNL